MLFSAAFKVGRKKVTFTFQTIENLEKFCSLVHGEFPDLMFYLFNRTRPTPAPFGFRATKTIYWCPYCAAPRKFVKSAFNPKKYKVCEICGISDAEYHVKKQNKLGEVIIFTEEGEVLLRKGGRTRKISGKSRKKSK